MIPSVVALSLVLLVLASLVLGQSYDGTCRDFVKDRCTYDKDNILHSVVVYDITDCEFLCSTGSWTDQCKYFYFDRRDNICNILSSKESACESYAGPKEYDKSNCPRQDEPCDVRPAVDQIWAQNFNKAENSSFLRRMPVTFMETWWTIWRWFKARRIASCHANTYLDANITFTTRTSRTVSSWMVWTENVMLWLVPRIRIIKAINALQIKQRLWVANKSNLISKLIIRGHQKFYQTFD